MLQFRDDETRKARLRRRHAAGSAQDSLQMTQCRQSSHFATLWTASAATVTEMLINKAPNRIFSDLDAIGIGRGPGNEMLNGAFVRMCRHRSITASLQGCCVVFDQTGNLHIKRLLLLSSSASETMVRRSGVLPPWAHVSIG